MDSSSTIAHVRYRYAVVPRCHLDRRGKVEMACPLYALRGGLRRRTDVQDLPAATSHDS